MVRSHRKPSRESKVGGKQMKCHHDRTELKHKLGEYPFCFQIEKCLECKELVRVIDLSISEKCHKGESTNPIMTIKGCGNK